MMTKFFQTIIIVSNTDFAGQNLGDYFSL